VSSSVPSARRLAGERQHHRPCLVIGTVVGSDSDGDIERAVKPVLYERQLIGRERRAVERLAACAGKAGKAVKIGAILVDDRRAGGQPIAMIFTPFSG